MKHSGIQFKLSLNELLWSRSRAGYSLIKILSHDQERWRQAWWQKVGIHCKKKLHDLFLLSESSCGVPQGSITGPLLLLLSFGCSPIKRDISYHCSVDNMQTCVPLKPNVLSQNYESSKGHKKLDGLDYHSLSEVQEKVSYSSRGEIQVTSNPWKVVLHQNVWMFITKVKLDFKCLTKLQNYYSKDWSSL